MTAPVSVGSVSVDLIAEAKGLAKSVRKEVESAFKGLNLGKLIRSSVGTTKISIPVAPDVDTDSIPAKVRRTRLLKVPVEIDPLLTQFQQQVRREITGLARQINANVPVGADTAEFRTQLGAQLKAIQATSRMAIPTEPGAKTEYEAKLRAELAAVAARVKQTVRVDVDVDKGGGGLSKISSVLRGISNLLPNIGGVSEGVASLAASIQKVAGSSAQLGGNLIGAFEAATGPIGIVIGALIAVATAAAAVGTAIFSGVTFAIPAVTALAGAIAAIPAALTGLAAVGGTLALGFKGIMDAFNPKKGGGGGAGNVANQARQVAAASRQVEAARRGIAAANRGLSAAERGYTNALAEEEKAQARARVAQEAVNRARREAAENISDLTRALAGARLDEEDAALRVTEAERALNEARLTGNLPDISRADLEYRKAVQTLEEAKEATGDLGEQQADAAAKGVEGSDKVQAALQDQVDAIDGVRRAHERVLDAQNAVLSAQDGLKSATDGFASAQDSLAQAQQKVATGSAAAVAEMVKLAPAAQRFVDAIKALKPAFEDLRLGVQQRLFAGLDTTITTVAKAWQKPLDRIFGSYADTFNRFFKGLGASFAKPKFIADMEAGSEGFRKGLDKIFASISGKLVPAFGTLSRAAGPFLDALGGQIAKVVDKFSEWVESGERSGALQEFFDNATVAMKEIFKIGGSVSSIIGSIIEIIVGKKVGTGEKSPLESFRQGLDKVAAWLKDDENQNKIRAFIAVVSDGVRDLIEFAKKVKGVIDTIQGVIDKVGEIKDRIKIALGIAGDDKSTGQGVGAAVANAVNPGGTGSLLEMGKRAGRDLLQGLIDGIKEKLDGFDLAPLLWEGPNSLVGRIKAGLGIQSPSTVMMAVGRDVIAGLIVGIGQKFGELGSRVGQIPDRIRLALGGAGRWLYDHGRNAVSGLGNGVVSMFGRLREWVRPVKNTVMNTLSDSWKWLYDHGRNTVIGLWNGIASMGGWLWSKVATFVKQNIRDAAKSALGIASPSRVTAELGKQVAAGLALGMESQASQVQAAADELARLAVPQVGDATFGLGLDADAAISRSLQVADNKSVQLSWKTGTTGDGILDAIAQHIDLRFNGNVQAALSRT